MYRIKLISAWLWLLGGGVAGYVVGGWPGAIVGAFVFFVGSAAVIGSVRGRREARTVYAAWVAAGRPGLAPRRPDATDEEYAEAMFHAMEAYKTTREQVWAMSGALETGANNVS
jgi:hypothetical protein